MLSEYQISSWIEKGYTIGSNIVEPELIKKSVNEITNLYNNQLLTCRDFGSDGKLEFPSNTILDKITINEQLITCVQKLLNTKDILLVQCDSWGKLGNNNDSKFSNNDQRMHMDYGNNGFLHPSDWTCPEAVSIIVYLSDVKDTSGGTAIVPKQSDVDPLYKTPYINMPGIHGHEFYNNKKYSEQYFENTHTEIYNFRKQLYERDIKLVPNIGDILFYRLDVWHRGTPVNNGKIRYVMNMIWKKKECFWINTWNPGWAKKLYYGHLEKLFIEMSPLQRSIFGVPLPGDKYCNSKNIEYLKARYPDIDILPYLEKLQC